MLPTAYEFHWDIGHIAFLGVFYGVLLTAISILAVATYRGFRDLGGRRVVAIEWQETFHDLPQERRHCRHEFDNTVNWRICNHAFDCSTCQRHSEYAAKKGSDVSEAVPSTGLGLKAGRLYHRGHTWVEPGPDGTLTVGLDDFASRCIGPPDRLALPAKGASIQVGERRVILERGDLQVRVPAPVAGEVVERGSLEDGWLYRVRPLDPERPPVNLLQGEEARVWMLRELEWLQGQLSLSVDCAALADGGTLVDDLMEAYPDADWDSIWGLVCLEA